MSTPNGGPEHTEPGDPDRVETIRRANPAFVFQEVSQTDDMAAATTRASAVTHRFGGVRYALTRRQPLTAAAEQPADEGDSDAHD